jgi:myo-inositol 2-dehydrogenase/D-chiro-inositol 1-dehydrogenase
MVSEQKLKVGLIGFGKRGLLHASLVNLDPRAELRAVCDRNDQLLSIMKNFYPDTPLFFDLDEMLEQIDLDTVFICTPDDSHLTLAEKLIHRNLNVFVETPLADSYASSKKMVTLISGKASVYSLGYSFPFKVIFQRAKALLNEGIIDTARRFRASLYWTLSRPFLNLDGVIRNSISTLFYLINWLFGPVQGLYARSSRTSSGVKSGISLILDHSSGLMGLVDISWSRPAYPLPTIKISVEGTGGTLEISDDCLKLYLFRKKGRTEKGWTTIDASDLPSPARFFLCEQGYSEANSSFIESCVEKKRPVVVWEDGLDVMRLIEAARHSMDSNRVIFLNEVK